MPSPGTSTVQLQPGQAFGKYLVEKALGQGGMGTVYKARDTRLNRNVALKMCTIPDNADALERFRREAQAAAQLSHTNLCPVFDYDVRDGTAYIAMAFIEGPSLADWLKTHSLEPRNAARLILKLARAMQEAHEAGVIHRDLKPGNVAISKKGEPVILDFGLARQVDDQRSRLTQSGGMMGTPSYMAPEQAMDAAEVGPAADVYSLGVILYEVMTRRVPFSASSVMALMMKVVNDPPEPPSRHNPAIDPELEAVCLKALAKTPQERYGSMQEFAIALARAIGTSAKPAVQTQPASPAETRPKPAPIKTGPPPLPVGIPLLPMSETVPPPVSNPITATVPWQDPLAMKASTSAPKVRRSYGARWLVVGLLIVVLAGLGIWGWRAARTPDKDNKPEDKVAERSNKDKGSPEKRQEQAKNDPPPSTPLTKTPIVLDLGDSVKLELVPITEGEFLMGAPDGEEGAQPNEKPQHKVQITRPFWLGRYTVTQEQYMRVTAKQNPSCFSAAGNGKDAVKDLDTKRFPVEQVSWNDAMAFCEELNRKHLDHLPEVLRKAGYKFRLPTEAQWEYACRAGTETPFSFGKELNGSQANCSGAHPYGTNVQGPNLGRTCPVGTYDPNPWGLFDMHGNVWQWCVDWYGERAYDDKDNKDPQGSKSGTSRVLRGGSWDCGALACRAAIRRGSDPGIRGVGFRVALRLDAPAPEVQPPRIDLTQKENSLGIKFVKLPKGTFYMGWDGVKKGTKTEIKEDFEIAIHTVTQGQWQTLMGNNPSYFSREGGGKDKVKDVTDADLKQFPVEQVSWDDVQKFIEKLNEREKGSGWLYRLPNEAEWEYSCRGGATSEEACSCPYYFDKPTNNISYAQANFNNSVGRTTKVDAYKPNQLGIYDMHGNVSQWCADCYSGTGGSHQVFRGGNWPYDAHACRAAYRAGRGPAERNCDLGFRVARVPSGGK